MNLEWMAHLLKWPDDPLKTSEIERDGTVRILCKASVLLPASLDSDQQCMLVEMV